MFSTEFCRALDFEEKAVYYPEVRPGYAAWASLFSFGNGDIGIAFNEIRRGENPDFNPPSLEFVQAMNIVYRESPDVLPGSNRHLISEYVSMKSSDNGGTWLETGRSREEARHYWYTGFPDGRLVRIWGTSHYCYQRAGDRFWMIVEESHDGGNTWKEISRFMHGYFFYVHKLKKLRDGSIVAVGSVQLSFGPGGNRQARNTQISGQCYELDCCFFISKDGGFAWDGPHYILPGVSAWEPDFVELPDGSLLFINSTVQAGRAVRQIVRKTTTGYVNEPMMEIRRGSPEDDNLQGGFTPETVIMTSNELIVGARRCGIYPCSRDGIYSCSDDLGENWYEIAGIPACGYQPIIEILPDGRFLTVWHRGGDTRFGEVDMFIGTHSFRLEASLPGATNLTLERERSADGNQYINAYRAKLTANGEPIAGRKVQFRTEPTRRPDGKRNTIPMDKSKNLRIGITDKNGIACVSLTDKDVIPDIHHTYLIDAVFLPESGDILQSCRSPRYTGCAMTPRRNCLANYPVYNNQGLIMITPKASEQFPELSDVIGKLDKRNPDAPFEKWVEVAGSEPRAREILDFLVTNHIVNLDNDGIYRWYRAVHCGDEVVKEVRICNLEEHCV